MKAEITDADRDPKKIARAFFLADGAEAALKSLLYPDRHPHAVLMVAGALKVRRSVKRRKHCTDEQMHKLERFYRAVRTEVHGKAEA